MDNKTVKAILCLLIIALVFAAIGCAERSAGKDDRGSTATASPAPAPAATGSPSATPAPSPTVQPGNAGNYTTDLNVDDVWFSGGDEEYEFPEDLLPTPAAE